MSETDKLAAQAARKRLLIAQGEMYRVGIVHARANVGYALRPESMLQGVVETAVGFAGHRVESLLAPGGMRLQGAMPYVLTALSFIGRKKLVKPALVLVAIAAVAASWLRRKR
ncbi:hypothetical protein SKZ59_24920 [Janthinobacterium sp. GMG2]|uniref:hypothetical protein n=1 Tax=Janthinobacterium sp. GMG2 TaxID=3096606 RepID=UPI0029F53BEF|nr:hypothetical protein [Janthinobacterium sp. GMG2]MDX8125026.1 hypothetical protein [Janthinobacterium sp. GMG2]